MHSEIVQNYVLYISFHTEVYELGYVEVWGEGVYCQGWVLPDLVSGNVCGQVEAEHILIEEVEATDQYSGLVLVEVS